MATRRGRLVLAVVAVLAIASLWRAGSVEREKRRLAEAYEQAQQAARQLSEERAHLNSELAEARQTVEGQAGELANLQQELQGIQDQLNATLTEVASLERDQAQLHQEKISLAMQLSSVVAEKQQLEMKLSSLKELKLAVRDVKRKISAEHWEAWRARIEALRDADREQLALGNRGYVVREGRSTLGSTPRLHVHVLEVQPQ